jgi:hypothetical protein
MQSTYIHTHIQTHWYIGLCTPFRRPIHPYIRLHMCMVKGDVILGLNWSSITPWGRVGEWRYSSTILHLDTRWRWMLSITLRPHYLRGKSPGTNFIGGWVDPRARLAAVEYRKICAPAGNQTPAIQPVAHPHTDWSLPASTYMYAWIHIKI